MSHATSKTVHETPYINRSGKVTRGVYQGKFIENVPQTYLVMLLRTDQELTVKDREIIGKQVAPHTRWRSPE